MYPKLISKLLQSDELTMAQLLGTRGRIYTFLNPVSYIEAMRHEELFGSFDGIFADGQLLVRSIRVAYGRSIRRRSFDMTSLAPRLFEYAEREHKTIAIIASRQEEVEKAVANIRSRYGSLDITYWRNGYFEDEAAIQAEAGHIADMAPDFLIVGMGMVLQERVLLAMRARGFAGTGFTCGGFMHQLGNTDMYYPRWIDRLNLRFVYRMYKEPHTRSRYARAAAVFPYKFWRERMAYRKRTSANKEDSQ